MLWAEQCVRAGDVICSGLQSVGCWCPKLSGAVRQRQSDCNRAARVIRVCLHEPLSMRSLLNYDLAV